jgi:hypothetical protein
MSMKNSSDTIGNGMRNLPVCSAEPQPIAPPRALLFYIIFLFLTAIGLTPGGSSPVHIYTQQYTEQHNETEYTERNIRNNKNTLANKEHVKQIKNIIHINSRKS